MIGPTSPFGMLQEAFHFKDNFRQRKRGRRGASQVSLRWHGHGRQRRNNTSSRSYGWATCCCSYQSSVISMSLCFTLILLNLAVSGDTTASAASATASMSSSTPSTTTATTTNSSSVITSGGGGRPEPVAISSSGSASSASVLGSISSSVTSSLEDHLRKEMIKVQILQRLGLTEKPQVDLAHKISRDLVLETLRRTETLDELYETSGGPILTTNRFQQHRRRNNSNIQNEDLSYAKTSEIISFPEKGPDYNGETLLTFSFAGTNAYGVGVRVKKAHLWVKMDHRSPIGKQFPNLFNPRGEITLYIFQVQGNFTSQSKMPTFVRTPDIDLEMVASMSVSVDALGWQKLDVTSVVQDWYSTITRHRHGHSSYGAGGSATEPSKNKLTLLVDCSGCGRTIYPITFAKQTSSPLLPIPIPPSAAAAGNNETESDNESENELEQQQQHQQPRHRHRHHRHHHRHHRNASQPHSHPHHHHYTKVNHTATAAAAAAFESFPDEHLHQASGESDDHLDNFSEIPFLVLETETVSPSVKRSRRRALECSPRVKQCCKQRFFISFAELGWQDWIIAPRGYYANYCRGHCGGVHRTPDTFLNYHTHVMEEYRRTDAGQVELNGITPCCAPTKFAAMSLIYFGPELNIIKRDLPKMIIEECGCP